MKITIYGAGAVGGLIAARLVQQGGTQVSIIARGRTLEAIQTAGLQLVTGSTVSTAMLTAESDPARLGVQDLVVLAVKATALADIAPQITPLLGPDTIVITAMNGVPWWFFENPLVPYAGMRLQSLDPDGALAAALPLQHLVGCVVHLSSTSPEPGVIKPGFGNRLIFGEAVGASSDRLARVVALFAAAGFDAEASADIRTDIWYKLWGNMTMNPLSAITGATCDKLLDDALVRQFCLMAMQEAATIGNRIGCSILQSGEERMQLTRKLGAFKTSMLQDAEAGRQMEIDALVGAVQEVGQHVGLPTPTIDSLLGLARLFGRSHGLYPQ
ncbi:2-dehydropantoate 2-reductase [Actimicrobium antarcticum]|uniref:2-dehydropantoate 2-reductase n=1 Tax=Actimicrobium antarcticum TaxID=1051899 RepID=A0ABP7SUF9_9BURK